MYLHNKYTIWYYNIINRAKSRNLSGYSEKHHIIPKSLGGSNNKNNIVNLTAKEHFICHLLLTKMVEGTSKIKMYNAAFQMTRNSSNQNRYKVTGQIYESLKRQKSLSMVGNRYGSRPMSDETKQKISEAKKGKKIKGTPRTEEWKQKLSQAGKGRQVWNKGLTYTNKKKAPVNNNLGSES